MKKHENFTCGRSENLQDWSYIQDAHFSKSLYECASNALRALRLQSSANAFWMGNFGVKKLNISEKLNGRNVKSRRALLVNELNVLMFECFELVE